MFDALNIKVTFNIISVLIYLFMFFKFIINGVKSSELKLSPLSFWLVYIVRQILWLVKKTKHL